MKANISGLKNAFRFCFGLCFWGGLLTFGLDAPISDDEINTHVTGIEIVSGTYQKDAEPGEVETFFEVEIYTDAAVQSVSLYKDDAGEGDKVVIEASENGNWFEWEDSGVGFESGYEYDGDEQEAEWSFEAYSTDAAAMAAMFGMGTYWIDVTYTDGSTDSTSVWFGAYNEATKVAVEGTDLASPAAAPVLTFSPAGLVYGAGSTVTISWGATADADTAGFFLWMENEIDHDQEVDTGALSAGEAGSYDLNQDGVWEVEAGYFNGYDDSVGIVNGDAIPLVVARIASREYDLTIGDYYTISGTITVDDSLTGTPRPGVFSDAELKTWVDADSDVEATATAGQWTYEIGPLPAGTYYVNAFLDADGDYQWEEGDLVVTYADEQGTPIAITLGPDATDKDFAFAADDAESPISDDPIADHVTGVEIIEGACLESEGTDYFFELYLTTDDAVKAVTFYKEGASENEKVVVEASDDGNWLEWEEAGVEFETGYEYDSGEGKAEWEFEAGSIAEDVMAAMFGMGTYYIDVTYTDDSTDSTSVWFGAYDETTKAAIADTDISAPAAPPTVTEPANGATYASGSTVTISWSATTDVNAGVFHLWLGNEADEELEYGPVAADVAGNYDFTQDGVWEGEAGYYNGYLPDDGVVNDDGISLMLLKAEEREIEVTVGDYDTVSDYLQWVGIGRYVDYGRPGYEDTTYNVEFEATTDLSVTAVTVTAPDGASYALTEWSLSDDGLSKEWFLENESTDSTLLSTTCPEGDYTVAVVYEGGMASTIVPFADWDKVSTMPVLTAVPAIVSPAPLDGESLALGSITVAWSNVDANANHIGFYYGMLDSDDETSLEFNDSGDSDGPLSTREYTVSDFSAGDWELCLSYGYGVSQDNADGVQYNVWNSNDSCYEFAIVEPVIPAIALDGVNLAVDPTGWSNLDSGLADTYFYQWKCNGEIIDGATGADLSLDQIDAGDTVTCVVTAQDGETVGEPYETDPVAVLELTAGWNLVSLPVEPWETDPVALLLDAATGEPGYVGAVWGWDAGRYEEATALEAGRGYWVFCLEAPSQPVLVTGSMPADTVATLQQDWNLLGPVGELRYRALVAAAVAYGWDGVNYAAPANNLLQKCRGYWILSDVDGVDLDLQTDTGE
jgi:hypothetical protein